MDLNEKKNYLQRLGDYIRQHGWQDVVVGEDCVYWVSTWTWNAMGIPYSEEINISKTFKQARIQLGY